MSEWQILERIYLCIIGAQFGVIAWLLSQRFVLKQTIERLEALISEGEK